MFSALEKSQFCSGAVFQQLIGNQSYPAPSDGHDPHAVRYFLRYSTPKSRQTITATPQEWLANLEAKHSARARSPEVSPRPRHDFAPRELRCKHPLKAAGAWAAMVRQRGRPA